MTPSPSTGPSRRFVGLALIGLLIAISLAYLPVADHGFVSLDDPVYVADNPQVLNGLSGPGIRWAFSTFTAGNWHPVTWLSHMTDVTLFGPRPGAFHLVNVAFHILNAMLLFLWLRGATGRGWVSLWVASAFALHPLRVESVAWIAERKDLLAGTGWLLALLAYHHYTRLPSPRRYAGVFLALAFSLMAKPMAVTLPLVLLLLDRWPYRHRAPVRRLVMEKVPLLALSLVASAVAVVSQRAVGAMHTLDNLPLGDRLQQAAIAYLGYIQKTIVPTDLGVLYPHPTLFLTDQQWVVRSATAVLLLLAISVGTWVLRRRAPALLVGWLWFLGTLVPVIGLVQVGNQAMADRYTYLPAIGLVLMVGFGLLALVPSRMERPVAAVGFALLLILGGATRNQAETWRDSRSLFLHASAVSSHNFAAHTELGVLDLQANNPAGAEREFTRALEINPNSAMAHHNLGLLRTRAGRTAEAVQHFEQAARLQPGAPEPLTGLGDALRRDGRAREAVVAYRRAIELAPDFRPAQAKLGLALGELGQTKEAIDVFAALVRSQPRDADAHTNLAGLALRTGDASRAERHFRRGLELDPTRARARFHLAGILRDRGAVDDAARELLTCLAQQPAVPDIHVRLAQVRMDQGQDADADSALRRALELSPDHADALRERAWLRATSRDRALRSCEGARPWVNAALQATPSARTLEVAAAVAAECGEYDEAIRLQSRVVAAPGPDDRAAEERLALYQQGKPFRR